jgi:hypothetical protein
MVSIEGMNLDVDDWHGGMDLNPFEFEQEDRDEVLALQALLAFGCARINKWRDRRSDPPDVAFYGAQKVAKTKLASLTIVLDISALEL